MYLKEFGLLNKSWTAESSLELLIEFPRFNKKKCVSYLSELKKWNNLDTSPLQRELP